jgi:hypothetical protein
LNTYDVLVSDDVVFTQQSLNDFLAFSRVEVASAESVQAPTEEVEEAR